MKKLLFILFPMYVSAQCCSDTIYFDTNHFAGIGTVGNKLKTNPAAFAAYLKSLPGWDSITSVYLGGDLRWHVYNGTEDTTIISDSSITWSRIGSDMEQYNGNAGMRKKSTSSNGWATPNQNAASSDANQTLSAGESIVVEIDNASLATEVVISTYSNPTFGASQWDIYAGYGLTANATLQKNGLDEGSQTSSASGYLFKLEYTSGNQIKFWKSTNTGSSWSLITTSSGTPTGTYYIQVRSYSPLGGFKSIHK